MLTERLFTKTEMEILMIESVVALLMFVNGEIKEQSQENMAKCLRGKRQVQRQYSASVKTQCWKGEVQNRDIHGPKSIKAIILK